MWCHLMYCWVTTVALWLLLLLALWFSRLNCKKDGKILAINLHLNAGC